MPTIEPHHDAIPLTQPVAILLIQRVRQQPADDAAAEHVEDERAVHPTGEGADVGSLRSLTRISGRHRFVALTVLVPGGWTVEQGHFLADDVEKAVAEALHDTTVQTHLEPRRVP